MKRLLLIGLVALAGCGGDEAAEQPQRAPSATATPFEPAPPADGGTQQGHRR